ncbi:putative ubiquitin-conjugating enzyme E2 18 [Sesamum angolense]|uniref:Ubiquitin-conjugating enzyme E2 18 n=1 Tax=Sesamum angolense TaxID=2727404 RepID=A0AAE1WCK5_9LAMI|nr:putative ubiquitin-conjugating enzyme E2 18 [Sesamum angolense]
MTSPSASSRKALSKIACNRLQKELVEWQVNPPAGFKHKVTDNLQRWVIEVNGAPGTLYAAKPTSFRLISRSITLWKRLRDKISFASASLLQEDICDRFYGSRIETQLRQDILYDSWSPAMTVSSICISILSMLSSSTVKQRPADNDRYVKNCKNGRSPKETRWWFHDDKVLLSTVYTKIFETCKADVPTMAWCHYSMGSLYVIKIDSVVDSMSKRHTMACALS